MEDYFNHTYYNTYYYANIVNNVLEGDHELIGFINNFFANDSIYYLIKPFQKKTAFHSFIEHIIFEFFTEDMDEQDSSNYDFYKNDSNLKFIPYAQIVLEQYGIKDYSFEQQEIKDYSDIEQYHTELYESGIFEELFEKIANEVFHLMFSNREALLNFNFIVALHMNNLNEQNIEDEDYQELKTYFTKSGKLKRVKIPEWCKKAVYFRDKGKCCLCHQDLSGTLSLNNKKHYDHIVPLSQGGLNDIANIQLLCASCNLNKGGEKIITSNQYERLF